MRIAVIMAGGQGERFWPLTHKTFPKYRIKVDKQYSLLQKTYRRLSRLYKKDSIFVVTTKEHAGLVRAELPFLKKDQLIEEPCRKNTAAAIYLSVCLIQKRFKPDAVLSFFPADHLIQNEALFRDTLENAINLAQKNEALVTVGIQPAFPACGYGYIKTGKVIGGFKSAFEAGGFYEKPDLKQARLYLKQKKYLWNGGIFTWKADVFLRAIRRFSPDIVKTLNVDSIHKSYQALKNISIDYALLEKADNLCVVKTTMDWCDMGSWDMFYEKGPKDRRGNYILGKVFCRESRDSLLLNFTDTPLSALGVCGDIIVQTQQGCLIAKRKRSEEAALLVKRST